MDLILWRHAEAEDTSPDVSRKLTARGHEQAKVMAEWLNKHLPENSVIYCSPATRTLETANALGRKYEILEELSPGATGHDILEAIQWPRMSHTVIVVGHQPSLGMAAAVAMSGKAQYWCVKKGNIWWLSNRVRADERETILKVVLNPDVIEESL